MKRVKTVRSVAVTVRVYPEECDILRFNAGLRGMSISDHIRQPSLGVHLRKDDKPGRYLVRPAYLWRDTAPRQMLRDELSMPLGV